MTILDPALAAHMARIALGHVTREYPHKLDHVLNGDHDAQPPRALHPIFFGSFDWHSCVHGWWTLLTLRRLFPQMAEAAAITDLAETSFTADKVTAELTYLDRAHAGGFERPYGWAWLLALHLEATRHGDDEWGGRLEPLARGFADRLRHYLAILTYPLRAGTHGNSAFALVLSLDWAEAFDPALAEDIRTAAWRWFSSDQAAQAWEPSGDDFLSSTLIEALAVARAQSERFDNWFAGFLPDLEQRRPATLFEPAIVSDRSDGKIAHLDGLNLSRAWCWRILAGRLEGERRSIALAAADDHLTAALPHIAGDYAGEHWLASFALLAFLALP